MTTIKSKRGTETQVQAYTPTLGEPIQVTNTNRAFIGDGLTQRGYPIIKNINKTPGNSEYYGTNGVSQRGFEALPEFLEFTPHQVTIGGSASKTTAYSSLLDIISMGTGADSHIYMFFRFSPLWDRTKDLKFKITYYLNGDTNDDRVVRLDSSVWVIDQDATAAVGSPDNTYIDYIRSDSTYNIDLMDSMHLLNLVVPSSELTGSIDDKLIIVKIQRSGIAIVDGNTEDNYIGSFRLANVFVEQLKGGESYGYYLGGYRATDTTRTSTIRRLVFPFNYGDMTEVGSLSSTRDSMAGFNSTRHLFAAGGGTANAELTASAYFSTIDKVDFPFDSGTSSAYGTLSGARGHVAGCSSSTFGFVSGGNLTNDLYSTVERFDFGFNAAYAGVQAGNISFERSHLDAFNSSTHGYILGGYNVNVAQPIISIIDRMTYPFASGTTTDIVGIGGAGTIDMVNTDGNQYGTYSTATCNSSKEGYTMGGQGLSSISRLVFPFIATSSTVLEGNLQSSKSAISGCNSSIFGYSMGGFNTGPKDFTQVERIAFPFLTGNAQVVGNLAGTTLSYHKGLGGDGTDFKTMFV